jgi:hypothetical protein
MQPSPAQRSQRTCSARRPGTGNDLQPQLTRLEQSGSGYQFHLIVPCLANARRRFSAEISPRTASGGALLCMSFHPKRAPSVLGRNLASYRLRRGAVVHVFHPLKAIPSIPVAETVVIRTLARCKPLFAGHDFLPSAFATSFLISSPRIPRATILPSGPTSTKAGIARMPNVLVVGF